MRRDALVVAATGYTPGAVIITLDVVILKSDYGEKTKHQRQRQEGFRTVCEDVFVLPHMGEVIRT